MRTFFPAFRLFCCPAKLKFLVEPMNIVDLIAILPWYITIGLNSAFGGTSVFRVIRMVRVFRVLKLGQRQSKLQLVIHAMTKSADMLGLVVGGVALLIVTFATLEYFVERGKYDPVLRE